MDLNTLGPLSITGPSSTQAKHFLWEYDLSDNSTRSVEVVFEELMERSEALFPDRVIRDHCVESDQVGRFVVRTACGTLAERRQVILLEVLGVEDQDLLTVLHKVRELIEQVLGMSPDIRVSRKSAVSDRHSSLDQLVAKLQNAWQDLVEFSWLPGRMAEWFRHHRDDGTEPATNEADLSEVLAKLNYMNSKMDQHHEAILKAMATEAQRRVPPCWTIECVSDYSLIVKIRSELTGKCYHEPIEIMKAPEFFEKYKKHIQIGLNVLVGLLPGTFTNGILDGLQPELDKFVAVVSVTKDLDLQRGDEIDMESTCGLPPDSVDAMLQDLLQIKFQDYANNNFDHLKVSSYCNLERAVHFSSGTLLAQAKSMNEDDHHNLNIETESSDFDHGEQLVPPPFDLPPIINVRVNDTVGQPRVQDPPRFVEEPAHEERSRRGSCASTVASTGLDQCVNGNLHLTILSGEGLLKVCLITRQRPYCRWTLYNPHGDVVASKKTKSSKGSGSDTQPNWGEPFTVMAKGRNAISPGSKLVFHVKTRRGYGGSSTVGNGELIFDEGVVRMLSDHYKIALEVSLLLKGQSAGWVRFSLQQQPCTST